VYFESCRCLCAFSLRRCTSGDSYTKLIGVFLQVAINRSCSIAWLFQQIGNFTIEHKNMFI
jgi:hypothetical protein